MRDYQSVGNHMIIGGVVASEIAERFGTPVYVMDEEAVRENFRRIKRAFSERMPTRIHYACKANTNLALLRILEQEGACIDAVSIGEVDTCLRAGFSPQRIMYTGVSVSNRELEGLVAREVMVNIDSLSEMRRLAALSTDFPVSIRVNPAVGAGHDQKVVTGAKGTKFGIPKDQIIDAYRDSQELGLRPVGMHAHIGSGSNEVKPFIEVTEVLLNLVNEIEDKLGIGLEFLDIGGGIGIPYRPEETAMDVESLAEQITTLVKERSSVPTLAIEPGRYIVADTTVLLTRVHDVKDTGERLFLGVDAGFNTLIRPSFYGSFHHVAVANKFRMPGEKTYDIVGPICETGDYLAKERLLPIVEEGDLLAVYDAGAYGFVMSSQYNSRPRCREVLVKEGSMNLIREAESMEDLLRHQRIPSRLII
jgi:diaminopimelate decarboxylase